MSKKNNVALKKPRSVYLILLLSYISILLLTISSGFVYYAKINSKIKGETERYKLTMLSQLTSEVENDILYISSFSDSLVFDTGLEQLAKGMSTYTYDQLMKDLKKEHVPNSVYDYFVYIAATDEIVSASIKMDAKRFFNIMYDINGDDYELFKNKYLNHYNFRKYMPVQGVNLYGGGDLQVLPFIQSFPFGEKEKPLGQVVFLIDIKNIASLINELKSAARSDVYILDSDNNAVLFSEDAVQISDDTKELINEKKVIYSSKDSNFTQHQSENSDWKYLMSTSKNIYYDDNRQVLISFGIIFFVYLAIGLIVVRILTKVSYRPIKEIRELIWDYDAESRSKNEFEHIKSTIMKQFKNDKQLNEVIQTQLPIIKRDYLIKIIKGIEVDYAKVNKMLQSVGVEFQTDQFIVASVEFHLDSPFFGERHEWTDKDLSLARLIVENAGCEMLQSNFICYYLDIDRNIAAYLVNIKSDGNSEDAVACVSEHMQNLMRFASEHFELDISAGISDLNNGIKNLQKCLDESRKAMEHCKMNETASAVCFSDLNKVNFDYYFSTEIEFQLVTFLKNYQYDQAKELLETVFEINMNSKNISANAAKSLIYDIASVLMRVTNSALISRGKEITISADILDELVTNVSLDNARQTFLNMIDNLSELSENETMGKTQNLVNSIAKYIAKNAGDVWLDLSTLSEMFDVTPQYISSIFKKHRNENIKDYIAGIKLNKAKELLVTTDMSVREISLTLGYSNEVGVIRLFKKYDGITPGYYRENNKKD